MTTRILTVFTTLFLLGAPAIAQTKKGESPFKPSEPKTHVEKIAASSATWALPLGGTADMENSATRENSNWKIAFQPNISLSIENTGDVPVKNPRVVTNGKRKWYTMQDILAEALAGAKTDQDKIYFIWDFVRNNRHHDDPIFIRDELHDPVKFLNVYGGGLCDDAGANGCSLWWHAGFTKEKVGKDPQNRGLHGHVQGEVFYDGNYQFMDIDESVFYLDRENEKPVSGDAVARDHDLAKREVPYGPIFSHWVRGQSAAALFGRDDSHGHCPHVAGHTMDLTLRPGEKIVYRWDNVGKIACDGSRPTKRRYFGNSKLVYAPPLTQEALKHCLKEGKDIKATDDGIVGTSPDAFAIIEIKTPYVVCGGKIKADLAAASPGDRCALDVSVDGKKWTQVWSATGGDVKPVEKSIDKELLPHKKPAKYSYLVRCRLASAALRGIEITTDVMANPHSLPRLSLGENKVEYSDETKEPHEITVTQSWQESSAITPPPPPGKPIYPEDGATVRDSTVMFKWPKVEGARRYHMRVSRRPDMRLPYRPCFDVVINGTEHGNPYTGIFSPDQTYTWRVRCQEPNGLWGEWGPTWTFRWSGPRVPVNLKLTQKGSDFVLSWEPNPRGNRPVAYEVYGSDERGFSTHKDTRKFVGLGEVPSNLIGKTSETSRIVVSPGAKHPNMNRAYYRVVAIDEHGTESGCSDYAEMPRPYIFTRPVTAARAGERYEYRMRTICSIGDYQARYQKPKYAYHEKEGYKFTLKSGPKWLTLDANSGVLSGTPGKEDAGEAEVEVLVETTYPHEPPIVDRRDQFFAKTDPKYQRSCVHRFTLCVHE